MLDHSNAQNGDAPLIHGRSQKTPAPAPTLMDREVPLESTRKTTALHAWLDGEGSLAAVTQAGAEGQRHVEFWTRLSAETERRREVKTPVHLQERIMEALPMTAPVAFEPWYRRSVTVSPVAALAAAAGLLALGAALSGSSRDR